MGTIEIPCANHNCDSEDIDCQSSTETRNGVFEHIFYCNACDTKFCIATELIFVNTPQEATQ